MRLQFGDRCVARKNQSVKDIDARCWTGNCRRSRTIRNSGSRLPDSASMVSRRRSDRQHDGAQALLALLQHRRPNARSKFWTHAQGASPALHPAVFAANLPSSIRLPKSSRTFRSATSGNYARPYQRFLDKIEGHAKPDKVTAMSKSFAEWHEALA